jgi:hypothetical protein
VLPSADSGTQTFLCFCLKQKATDTSSNSKRNESEGFACLHSAENETKGTRPGQKISTMNQAATEGASDVAK